jgi:segregation and condensation protein B
MIFKTIGKFFRSLSGFIGNSLSILLRRGRNDLEDQQQTPANNQPAPVSEDSRAEPKEPRPLQQPDELRPVSTSVERPLPQEDEPRMESREEQPVQQAGSLELQSREEQPLQQRSEPQGKTEEQLPQQEAVEPQQKPEESMPVVQQRELNTMADSGLKSAIESLLFIAGNPLSLDRLKGIFEDAAREQIETQIEILKQGYESRGSGIMLVEVAGGYQLVTRPQNAVWIRKFRSVKVSSRLSRPALETLAIVAYKQPITRAEVEAIRGVNIGGIMRNLMERRLVKIVGKKDVPGKPMMYGTSLEFLQYFGLKDLSSLPTLKEFQELEPGEEVMQETPVEGEDAAAPDETETMTATATKE